MRVAWWKFLKLSIPGLGRIPRRLPFLASIYKISKAQTFHKWCSNRFRTGTEPRFNLFNIRWNTKNWKTALISNWRIVERTKPRWIRWNERQWVNRWKRWQSSIPQSGINRWHDILPTQTMAIPATRLCCITSGQSWSTYEHFDEGQQWQLLDFKIALVFIFLSHYCDCDRVLFTRVDIAISFNKKQKSKNKFIPEYSMVSFLWKFESCECCPVLSSRKSKWCPSRFIEARWQ